MRCHMNRAASLFSIALLGGLGGCQGGGLTVAETNAILTAREPGRDFSEYRSYALSDHVKALCLVPREVKDGAGGASGDEGAAGAAGAPTAPDFNSSKCTKGSTALEEDIFEALAEGMQEAGYERVDSPKNAELVLLVARVARDHWYFASNYGICDEFIDACVEPQLGPKYLIPTESLALVLVDQNKKNEVIWLAAIPKVFASGAQKANVQRAIAQAFAQSPYLEVDP